jgi:hypothetical protein
MVSSARAIRAPLSPKEETLILRTALPTLLRQSFTLKRIVESRQIVVIVGQRCRQLWGGGGAEKKTDATSAPRGADVELRELRIELAELRIANTELRQMLTAGHVTELPNPLCSHRVN